MEFVTRTRKTPQAHTLEAVMNLEVSEAHLNALSFVTRLEKRLRTHQPARHVASALVKITGDFPSWLLGTTPHLKFACIAVEFGALARFLGLGCGFC
jgi:hypothetical protein